MSRRFSSVVTVFALSATTLVSALSAHDGADFSTSLDPVVIYGRSRDLIGQANSAAEGEVGGAELDARPFLRRGELLEVVPGLVVTQHSGSGKANQYFLRGFNLDHGTDFAVTVDGLPVNMRTHAHGQGYADINFIIPEFVESIAYQKGLSFAENGDFSAAGAAQFHLVDSLPLGFAKIELGEDEFTRFVTGDTFTTGPHSSTTVGLEAAYANGPWDNPEHSRRFNLFARHIWSANGNDFSLTTLGYHGEWDSTDQVPLRAIAGGQLDRFGAVDPTDGGDSDRGSLSFDWTRRDADATTRLTIYAIYSRLDLYSNFSYFLNDPVNGDQFNQRERRGVFGGEFSRDWTGELGGRTTDTKVGLQVREDLIDVGLYNTAQRDRLSTVRADDVNEASIGLFAENTFHATDWWRIISALRGDAYRFDVDSDLSANSGVRTAAIASPKLSLVFGPWAKTEVYLNGGYGFHSNDARGVLTTVDPSTGLPVARADPLVRATSAELGVRTSAVRGLVSTLSAWVLDLDSELVFVGDGGTTEPGGATRRYGVEWANFYQATDWLALDADLAFTHARFTEDPAGAGTRIPNSISSVLTAGAVVNLPNGWSTSLRARYFGPQPLIEDDSVIGPSSLTFNGRVAWKGRTWQAAVDVLNIFDRANNDIAYFYESRLAGEPAGPGANGGYDDVHLHPAEPRTFRLSITRWF